MASMTISTLDATWTLTEVGQAAHAGLLLLRGHAALLHQTVQTLADAGLPPLKGGLALVVQNDLIASLDGSLRDTAAHQTRTDDKNFADFHFDLLLFIHNGDARALDPGPASAETGALPLCAERFSHSAVGILSQGGFLCLGKTKIREQIFWGAKHMVRFFQYAQQNSERRPSWPPHPERFRLTAPLSQGAPLPPPCGSRPAPERTLFSVHRGKTECGLRRSRSRRWDKRCTGSPACGTSGK